MTANPNTCPSLLYMGIWITICLVLNYAFFTLIIRNIFLVTKYLSKMRFSVAEHFSIRYHVLSDYTPNVEDLGSSQFLCSYKRHFIDFLACVINFICCWWWAVLLHLKIVNQKMVRTLQKKISNKYFMNGWKQMRIAEMTKSPRWNMRWSCSPLRIQVLECVDPYHNFSAQEILLGLSVSFCCVTNHFKI